jgi:hypothetical protein
MEAKATAAGYRTAFLDVYPDHSMWDNGALVAGAVDRVKAAFSGAGVVLVCHSKGGVDGQTALVYYGASAKVDRLITLSTPHRGTPLADLAWSAWAGWLADLLGSKNEGNRVLQTGYMASFRSQTDALPSSRVVPAYTAGGTKAGPWFSAYWFGGMAIGRTSDGVVPLDSTSLSYQKGRLFTAYLNHDEVKKGSNAWPSIQACLATPLPLALAPVQAEASVASEPQHTLDRLYRGGITREGMAEFSFPVDADQPSLQVLLQTAGVPRRALLISPSGRLHALIGGPSPVRRIEREDMELGDDAFPGSAHRQMALAHPEAGLWRVQISAQGEDAYFFTAIFPGDGARVLAHGEAREAIRGGHLMSSAAGAGNPAVAVHSVRTGAARSFAVAGSAQPLSEPAVMNHTLVLTWPGGRERAVIFSEAQ